MTWKWRAVVTAVVVIVEMFFIWSAYKLCSIWKLLVGNILQATGAVDRQGAVCVVYGDL